MTGGYSAGLLAVILDHWDELQEGLGLPRAKAFLELASNTQRRRNGGGIFEITACYRTDVAWGLAQLDDRDRQLLELRYTKGIPFYKVAQQLGCNRKTIRPLIDEALERLADLLNGHGGSMVTKSNGKASKDQDMAAADGQQELYAVFDALEAKLAKLPPIP